MIPALAGMRLLPLRSTNPAATSFSRIAALVAGVPSPLRSASSGISSLPAFSIADRRVSSVYALGGAVKCSVTAASTWSKVCPSVKSGRAAGSAPSSGCSFREARKMWSISRQPSERMRRPLAVKVCPPQVKVAVTVSYTKSSATAHNSSRHTSSKVFRSPTVSSDRSASPAPAWG